MLAPSLNYPGVFCCMIVAYCEFFGERIERGNLRLIHGLDVDVLCHRDCRVPQDCLYGLVIHSQGVKVGGQSAAETMPAVPRSHGSNYTLSDIVEVQRLAISSLEDRQGRL